MDDLELRRAWQRYLDAQARVVEVQEQRQVLYAKIGLLMAEITRLQGLLDDASGRAQAHRPPTLH